MSYLYQVAAGKFKKIIAKRGTKIAIKDTTSSEDERTVAKLCLNFSKSKSPNFVRWVGEPKLRLSGFFEIRILFLSGINLKYHYCLAKKNCKHSYCLRSVVGQRHKRANATGFGFDSYSWK